jgi:molecular chaperone GrpE (heat shock protein)
MKTLKLLSFGVLVCLTPLVYSMDATSEGEEEITLEQLNADAERLTAGLAGVDQQIKEFLSREQIEAIATAVIERVDLSEKAVVRLSDQVREQSELLSSLKLQCDTAEKSARAYKMAAARFNQLAQQYEREAKAAMENAEICRDAMNRFKR